MVNRKNILIFLRKHLSLLLLCFIIFSCAKKEPIREAVSIEEILGETKGEEIKNDNPKEMPKLDGTFVSELNQKLYQSFNFSIHQESTLLDRFSYDKVEKSLLTSLSDSSAIAKFFKYDFPDSSSTNNAFNNWLSCFGNKCEEIKLGETKNNVGELPLWCGVFEKAIIIVKFSEPALVQKNQLKKAVFQSVRLPLKHTLNVTKDNILRWD